MMDYKTYNTHTHNNVEAREELEWSNFWYEESNRTSAKRVLLVGDSTARMVRRYLQKKLSMPVDLFATSSGLHDVLFCNQINAFFCTGRKYIVAYVQLGNHSRINDKGEEYNSVDYNMFKEDLLALNAYLHNYCENVIYATAFECVKPVSKLKLMIELVTRIKLEEWDEDVNKNTRCKNDIIKEVASICASGGGIS